MGGSGFDAGGAMLVIGCLDSFSVPLGRTRIQQGTSLQKSKRDSKIKLRLLVF